MAYPTQPHTTPSAAVLPADDETMFLAIAGKKPATPAQLASYRQELVARGFEVVDEPPPHRGAKGKTRVFASMAQYRAMTPAAKHALMLYAGGFSENGDAGISPTEVSTERRMKYPVQPPPGKSWQQFMGMSSEQVKSYAELTSQREAGVLARQHFWDAFSSLYAMSWRYDDRDGRDAQREAFRVKFAESIGHCQMYGPLYESPNDPAPPINPNDPTADFFMNLSTDAVFRLKQNMAARAVGRNARTQLKRACELAPDAIQQAMLAEWENELLRLYPEEWVWPVGYDPIRR